MISRPFDEILPEHISGRWKVKSSTLSPQADYFRLASVVEHTFQADGTYSVAGPEPASGTWSIERNEEIIPNPIIYFELPNPRTNISAMITRLAYMPYTATKRDEMILYFSNGCELVLEKIQNL
ncbi:MAG: hypothetical protein V4642_01140 [Bacteroidota bacterium]